MYILNSHSSTEHPSKYLYEQISSSETGPSLKCLINQKLFNSHLLFSITSFKISVVVINCNKDYISWTYLLFRENL